MEKVEQIIVNKRMTYQECKIMFLEERSKEDGFKVMQEVVKIINEVGRTFLTLNGGELYEYKIRLAGNKFLLSDYNSELERIAESLKIEIKEFKAATYDIVAEEIKAKEGRVKNVDQIKNGLQLKTADKEYLQILYQTMYHQYKLKLSAVDDVTMTITQRIKDLSKLEEDAKY